MQIQFRVGFCFGVQLGAFVLALNQDNKIQSEFANGPDGSKAAETTATANHRREPAALTS